MATTQTGVVLRHIRRLAALPQADGDRELLSRFVARRDEAAFTALVKRHGPLVFGVCRRVLGNTHDAEDAFQASFLVLARKASAIHRHESVAGWLHQVAFHLAMRVRSQSTTRLRYERATPRRDNLDPLTEVSARELMAALDEELQALPDSHRVPLILCYLESQTRDEAARQLHCSLSTLKRRLEEGKARLHARLVQSGLALSVAMLSVAFDQGGAIAAVPSLLLAATVKASLGTGCDVIPASVESLAQAALKMGNSAKIKIAAVLVLATGLSLLGGGALTIRSPAQAGTGARTTAAAQGTEGKSGASPAKSDKDHSQAQAKAGAGQRLTLAGRVVDAQNKPVPGVQIVVLPQTVRPFKDKDLFTTDPNNSWWSHPALGQMKTDADGRFHLTFPRSKVPSWLKPPEVAVIGLAQGHAVGWEGVEVKGDALEAVVRLGAEEPIHGRIVDLQGVPAAGVKLSLLKAAHESSGKFTGLMFGQPLTDAPYWPTAVTTDDNGRFTLRGVNRSMSLRARVQSDRFATEELTLEPGAMGEATLSLPPARIFEGRVIAEDTRQPMAGVGVHVTARRKTEPTFAHLFARTDKDGRFRINHYAADGYYTNTDDVPGQPYFAINHIEVAWNDKLKTKQSLEIALPRGVLQSGKVVDAATGKPLADAQLMYLPQLFNNPLLKERPGVDLWVYQIGRTRTKADGTFQIPVLPGPGHIEVHAPPGKEYVTHTRTRKEIFGHEREGGHWPANAFVKVNIKPDAEPAEVTAKLLPAVTMQGKLLGPDGKPVANARMAVRTLTADPHQETGIKEEHGEQGLQTGPTIHVKDGEFTLPGCDAAMRYRAYVLDQDNHQAATFELVGKEVAPKPLTMKWQACASAKARFVDSDGKALSRQYPVLVYIQEDLEPGKAGSAVIHRPAPFTDVLVTAADGTAALKDLIPGVTYVLHQPDSKESKKFTPEAGKDIDLGDITVDPKK
jgi:RNA polymerase sigma factor (sigma-70 family)